MRRRWAALVLIVVLTAISSRARVLQGSGSAEPAPNAATGALADGDDMPLIAAQSKAVGSLALVQARALFVSFPPDASESTPDSMLLPWSNWLMAELRDYVATMSRGRQKLDLRIVKRLGADSTKAWRAPHPASYYRNDADPCPCKIDQPCSGCELRPTYATLNNEIMKTVDATYRNAGLADNYWAPVQVVFVITYQNVFSSPTAGGIAMLGSTHVEGTVGLDVPGFRECFADSCELKRGVTQRLFPGDFTSTMENQRVAGSLAHEYGHLITARGHSPKSGNPPSDPMPPCGQPEPAGYVNVGQYDMMRGFGDARWTQLGAVPLHPRWLEQPDYHWVPTEKLTQSVRNLVVADIRGSNGKCFEIVTSVGRSTQSFLFANYQGMKSSRFDAKLGGRGLLIWHVLAIQNISPVEIAWDLESAAGKQPDVTGRDGLENDWCALGGAADFFGDHPGAGGRNFSAATNPNTNLYVDIDKETSQSIRSSIAIENIRADPTPGSSAMLVDVYLDPRQYVIAPNGGEVISRTSRLTTTWQVRPLADIRSVDVEWSRDGGQTFQLVAGNLPNTGSYAFTPPDACDQCRVRVTSYDTARKGIDISDADFTVTDSPATDQLPRSQPLFVRAAPNPFNPTTRIWFGVDRRAPVRLAIFDVSGREVRRLIDTDLSPGIYASEWNGADAAGRPLASGVFAYRLSVGADVLQGKLVLLK